MKRHFVNISAVIVLLFALAITTAQAAALTLNVGVNCLYPDGSSAPSTIPSWFKYTSNNYIWIVNATQAYTETHSDNNISIRFSNPRNDSFVVDNTDGVKKNSTQTINVTPGQITPSSATINRYFNKLNVRNQATGAPIAASIYYGISGLQKGNTNLRPINGSASAGYAFPVVDSTPYSANTIYFDVNGTWTEITYAQQNWYNTMGIYTANVNTTTGVVSIQ